MEGVKKAIAKITFSKWSFTMHPVAFKPPQKQNCFFEAAQNHLQRSHLMFAMLFKTNVDLVAIDWPQMLDLYCVFATSTNIVAILWAINQKLPMLSYRPF